MHLTENTFFKNTMWPSKLYFFFYYLCWVFFPKHKVFGIKDDLADLSSSGVYR